MTKEVEEGSTLGAFAKTLTRVPENVVAAGIKAVQGVSGASVTERGIGDRFVNWVEKRNEALSKEYEKAGDFIPGVISKQDVAQLGPNLAFGGTTMLGTVAGGAAGIAAGAVTGGPVGAFAGKIAGSVAGGGLVAHRIQSYQAMNDWLNRKNEESIRQFGRAINPEEEAAFKNEFGRLASKSGLWEAGPEATGNVLELALLIAKSRIPGGKAIPDSVVRKIAKGLARIGGVLGVEELTEAITQMGQHNVEVEAGQAEGPERKWASPEDWLKSAKEVLPQVLMLTGFMGAGGAVYRKAAEQRRKEEAKVLANPVDVNDPNASDKMAMRYQLAIQKADTIPANRADLKEQWIGYASSKINKNLPIDVTSPLDAIGMQIDTQMDELPKERASITPVGEEEYEEEPSAEYVPPPEAAVTGVPAPTPIQPAPAPAGAVAEEAIAPPAPVQPASAPVVKPPSTETVVKGGGELSKYADRVVSAGDVKQVSLVGSTVAKGIGRDTDLIYDFGKRTDLPIESELAEEYVTNLIEKQPNINLDAYDSFIRVNDRYFHVSGGAGRMVIENTEYGMEQAGKPTKILATAAPAGEEAVASKVLYRGTVLGETQKIPELYPAAKGKT
jgi:hypothetical protein